MIPHAIRYGKRVARTSRPRGGNRASEYCEGAGRASPSSVARHCRPGGQPGPRRDLLRATVGPGGGSPNLTAISCAELLAREKGTGRQRRGRWHLSALHRRSPQRNRVERVLGVYPSQGRRIPQRNVPGWKSWGFFPLREGESRKTFVVAIPWGFFVAQSRPKPPEAVRSHSKPLEATRSRPQAPEVGPGFISGPARSPGSRPGPGRPGAQGTGSRR